MLKITLKIIFILILVGILLHIGVPKLASFYHNKGIESYDNQAYEQAAEFFEKSLAVKSNKDTYDYLAHAYEKLQRADEAIIIYHKLIAQDPLFLDAYIALSNIYLQKGMFENAAALLERARGLADDKRAIDRLLDKVYHDRANDVLNQGIILHAKGDKDGAYYLLRNALAIKPDFAYAHYVLGYYLYLDNKTDMAEAELRAAISIDQEYWKAHKLLGDIFFKRQQYDKAISAYNNVLTFNSDDYSAYNDIAISLVQIERYSEAIFYLQQALRLNPRNLDIIYNLASVYRDAGLFDEAIKEYNRLLGLRIDYPNTYNNLADIYITQGMQAHLR
jgi:tetratricopeptide (TPR) repeat protein